MILAILIATLALLGAVVLLAREIAATRRQTEQILAIVCDATGRPTPVIAELPKVEPGDVRFPDGYMEDMLSLREDW